MDDSLLAELPDPEKDEVEYYDISNHWGFPEYFGVLDGSVLQYHFCRFCDSWIRGTPLGAQISNLGILSGRRGVSYYCRRCQQELGFLGIIA